MTPDWWWFAKEDLGMARELLEGGHHPEGVTFHCQQAVEKMLKGALRDAGQIPPRIHDLMKLLDLCEPAVPGSAGLRDVCHALNKYYVPARYPDAFAGSGPEGLPILEDARKAVEAAAHAWDFFEARRRPQVKERRGAYRAGRRRR